MKEKIIAKIKVWELRVTKRNRAAIHAWIGDADHDYRNIGTNLMALALEEYTNWENLHDNGNRSIRDVEAGTMSVWNLAELMVKLECGWANQHPPHNHYCYGTPDKPAQNKFEGGQVVNTPKK